MESHGYCVFVQTLSQGPVPLVRDGDGNAIVFATEREAQLEIIDGMMTRLQEFIDGERDFEDAVMLEDSEPAVKIIRLLRILRVLH